MSRKNRVQIVEADIQGLSKKGDGIALYGEPSRRIEIPFSAPEDRVLAEVRKKKGSKLLEVIKPSKLRIPPKCVHFGSCGGCKLQHLPYEEQLNFKQGVIAKLFNDLLLDRKNLLPIIPSKPWGYRNKMEFSFSMDKEGNKYLGLILLNSRGKVFNLTECHLVNSWMVDALKAARSWWEGSSLQAYHPPKNQGSLRTLTVREGVHSGDRLAMLTVSGNPDFALSKADLDTFVKTLREAIEPKDANSFLSIFLRIQQILPGKPTEFYEMKLYGKEGVREQLTISPFKGKEASHSQFMISPSSFFQPNSEQAEKLYSLALQMAELKGGEVVYDLYCGTGTLGISFAKWAKQVIGVEISSESALDARENAKANGFENVTIFTGSCASILQEKSLPPPDLLLLDPPRVGLEKAVQEVIVLKSPTIIYISCNPETQAMDIKILLENGYQLVKIQPVDQFPHTPHIENIALLKKL